LGILAPETGALAAIVSIQGSQRVRIAGDQTRGVGHLADTGP
jgi:hypothetical protein